MVIVSDGIEHREPPWLEVDPEVVHEALGHASEDVAEAAEPDRRVHHPLRMGLERHVFETDDRRRLGGRRLRALAGCGHLGRGHRDAIPEKERQQGHEQAKECNGSARHRSPPAPGEGPIQNGGAHGVRLGGSKGRGWDLRPAEAIPTLPQGVPAGSRFPL